MTSARADAVAIDAADRSIVVVGTANGAINGQTFSEPDRAGAYYRDAYIARIAHQGQSDATGDFDSHQISAASFGGTVTSKSFGLCLFPLDRFPQRQHRRSHIFVNSIALHARPRRAD